MAATLSLSAPALSQRQAMRARKVSSAAPVRTQRTQRMAARADYIGSSTNIIFCTSTFLLLSAGRFGLMPTGSKVASAGLKLTDRKSGMQSGDPSGFSLFDVAACGSIGHILAAGIVLGLRGTGNL